MQNNLFCSLPYKGAVSDCNEFRSEVYLPSIDKKWLIINPSGLPEVDIPNVTFEIPNDNTEMILLAMKNNIKFMVKEPCSNWEMLYYLVEILKVSQVRVGGELGFQLPEVSKYLKKNNVKLRIFEPYIPNSLFEGIDIEKQFFILPTWAAEASPYVDVWEFDSNARKNSYVTGNYFGDLGILTKDKLKGIEQSWLPAEIGKIRLQCKRKCIKGGDCKLCDKSIKLGKIIEKSYNKMKE